MSLIKVEPGWVCCYCEQPVELIAPGAWWRHVGDQGACEYRLMDDAYNEIDDRWYQPPDDEDEHGLTHVEMADGSGLTPACDCGWYSPNHEHAEFEAHLRRVRSEES